MQREKKIIVGTLAAAGITLSVFASTFLVERLCHLRFTENLILREKPRPESVWEILESPSGYLFRMKYGEFRGWYLAADDLVNSTARPPFALRMSTIGLLREERSYPYVRNLILREATGADCYWDLTDGENGVYIQPARGSYAGWYLGFQKDYVPDLGQNPRTAWNLVLTEKPLSESEWKRTRTDGGSFIQATSGATFRDWYLDCLHEAKILERNRCSGEEATRDGPSPPLAR